MYRHPNNFFLTTHSKGGEKKPTRVRTGRYHNSKGKINNSDKIGREKEIVFYHRYKNSYVNSENTVYTKYM